MASQPEGCWQPGPRPTVPEPKEPPTLIRIDVGIPGGEDIARYLEEQGITVKRVYPERRVACGGGTGVMLLKLLAAFRWLKNLFL